MSASEIERHYTQGELAELLSVSVETIRRATVNGHLHSIRVGADRRYPASAVQQWIDAGAQTKPKTGSVVPIDRRRVRASSDTGRSA